MKLLVKQTLMSPVVSHIALVASRFTYRFGRQSFHISLWSPVVSHIAYLADTYTIFDHTT